MKVHNGMRPQDIVVLLKILTIEKKDWQFRDMAYQLDLSISEISESLIRSHIAGLVDESKRRVFKNSLLEFIEHGLHYVFPQQPGTLVTGIPTAHSYSSFREKLVPDIDYVWEDTEGTMRGLQIKPLYKGAPQAARTDENLYSLLAAIDCIRVGKVREVEIAKIYLRKFIKSE